MFSWLSSKRPLDDAGATIGPVLTVTPTMNSVEVSFESGVVPSGHSSSRRTIGGTPSDPVERLYARSMTTYVVSCPVAACLPLQMQLFCPGIEDAQDNGSSGSEDDATQVPALNCDLALTVEEAKSGWHLLPAGQACAIIVRKPRQPEITILQDESQSFRAGDAVLLDSGLVGLVTGPAEQGTLPVDVMINGDLRVQHVQERHCKTPVARGSLLVFNTCTLPGLSGLSSNVTRSFLLPRDDLGLWLLGLRKDYAYAASLTEGFVVKLLEHGLFVLPGSSQIFSCPFPITPFIFKLQEQPPHGKPQRRAWQSCKMLKRYGKQFEMSCNCDFQGHLRKCAQYHEGQGGTWINDALIELLVSIHRNPSNKIRMYCFELWDKATGCLAAASFGLSIGRFFHDFSMCCLVKDSRSSGAILSKAIGALLAACGVSDWYWGCKMGYMADYEKHGAMEIPRSEYYQRLRLAMQQDMTMDPCDAISAGNAVIPTRACGSL